MRFNCGPSLYEHLEAERKRLESWHSFFALFPRRITGTQTCVWLEWIERKGEFGYDYGGCDWAWEYRLPTGDNT